jgi:hypothetical protein
LLFYFGYVGTRARYEYFGVDLTMVDLSTQELVLAGLEIAYVAALAVCVVVLVVVSAHAAVWWLLISGRHGAAWVVAGLTAVVALLLLGRAVLGVVIPAVAAADNPPGETRLLLGLAPAVLAYSAWLASHLIHEHNGHVSTFTRWVATPTVRLLRRVGVATVLAIFVVGLFAATQSLAAAFGTGRAYDNALHLGDRPEVILDVRERLQGLPAGVTETRLDVTGKEGFRYRYHGLRLLVESGGRLFLVPTPWTRTGRTIIVPFDSEVRIQLVPAPVTYAPP